MIARSMELPNIRACLFDMDGLLIDTEDIYTSCNNVILHEYGKPSLPWSIKAQLQGRPAPDASEIFHEWAQLPISRPLFAQKQAALQAQFFPTSRPLPGVPHLLKSLKMASTPIALATSSHSANFVLKTAHQQTLFSAFPAHRRVLGDDARIPKGRGKPAPDIYLLALEILNADIRAAGLEREILPSECLVFEDSVPGIEAGRRAGMRVIWCPHPQLLKEYAGKEEEVLAGIANLNAENEDVGTDSSSSSSSSSSTAGKSKRARSGQGGQVGKVGDGWGELVFTLEGLDLAKYGLVV